MNKLKGVMFFILVVMLMVLSCSGPESDQLLLTAEVPLHLEEHLEAARIEGSEVPEDVPIAVEWNFGEPQPDWKPAMPINETTKPVKVIHTEDALRVILNESNFNPDKIPVGGIYINLPGWHREHWAYIQVRARTSEKIRDFNIGFNLREQPTSPPSYPYPFRNASEDVLVITDGSEQAYLIRADSTRGEKWEGRWQQLGIWFAASEPASIDILSIRLIPKETSFAGAPAGLSTEIRSNSYRRTLYTHVPGRLEYKVHIPNSGRLDVGMGVLREDVPVTFKISASQSDRKEVTLFEEIYANQEEWGQRTIDLSKIARKTVRIALETDAERRGTVALWAAPTISSTKPNDKPNVIFYVIDGAGAEHMSLYGYNRRTTPNLERLAAEGALFEYAYSNSDHTKYSTPSFMTSLHNSVLGGFRTLFDKLPEQAVTMAEHMHNAGYQTGVFVSNPLAGSLSNLQRGVDVFRDAGVDNNSTSSVELHEDFWRWRKDYPSEPYWVHFQTTDVHYPHNASAPFAGLFVSPELRNLLREWRRYTNAVDSIYDFEKTFDRLGWANAQRGVYDETMAHQDYQIGRFVERLKASGEWERTLLIVAADHGVVRGAGNGPDLGLLDTLPPPWVRGRFRSSLTRIPMIFIWPGKIAPGQRFSDPVSMIDMLPTILDFAGIPMPEIVQGQSLAPLLLGREGWEPQPVIFDQFRVDQASGELRGTIDVIDGRWGASLEINPDPEQSERSRPTPLLLFDIWNDPMAVHPANDDRPDLVEKYTKFLEEQWRVHQILAKQFTRSKDSLLTPEQLETLRSLGYIR